MLGEKNDAIAFAVEIDSELEYVLVMFCPYTSENLVIGRMAVCQLRTLVLGESERYDRNNFYSEYSSWQYAWF